MKTTKDACQICGHEAKKYLLLEIEHISDKPFLCCEDCLDMMFHAGEIDEKKFKEIKEGVKC